MDISKIERKKIAHFQATDGYKIYFYGGLNIWNLRGYVQLRHQETFFPTQIFIILKNQNPPKKVLTSMALKSTRALLITSDISNLYEITWLWRNDDRWECSHNNTTGKKRPEKGFRLRTGFEPTTLALRVQFSPNWAAKVIGQRSCVGLALHVIFQPAYSRQKIALI